MQSDVPKPSLTNLEKSTYSQRACAAVPSAAASLGFSSIASEILKDGGQFIHLALDDGESSACISVIADHLQLLHHFRIACGTNIGQLLAAIFSDKRLDLCCISVS